MEIESWVNESSKKTNIVEIEAIDINYSSDTVVSNFVDSKTRS